MKIIRDHTGAQANVGYVVEIENGRAKVYLDIDHRHINRGDSLHGGVIATILDAACGYAVSLSVDGENLHQTATLSLTVNYLSRVRDGRVFASAKVSGGGKNTVFVDAELIAEDHGTVATATGTFKLFTKTDKI
ncbi:MAG: PaaI family thioesterase [Hyphomicrobiales bacterium]|nr:PaaI family thioesterase [Hyphomicrobiales bacterium]MCP5000033.1 PaaI family thioesterase [Hyphomicrobiales bacterium]